jgi:ABC-type glycerol-3-phosphate transport system substrate-binding protein
MNGPRAWRAAVAVLLAAGLLCLPGCTAGKKRAPGPLVVWFLAEPEAEPMFRTLAEEFRKQSGTEVKLVIKNPHDFRAALLNHPEDLKSQADLIEVDLFDLEDAAPVMDDLTPLMPQIAQSGGLNKGAFSAGEFNGRQLLIPWRLSWPVMVASNRIKPPRNWDALARIAQQNPGQVLVPALDDQEFFAFLCSLVWSFKGDPAEPYGAGILEAFQWLESASNSLSRDSGLTRAKDMASLTADEWPLIFFEWPQGLLPFILNGSLQIELNAVPYPCGGRGNCAVFSFGRYLGVPRQARHPEDAKKFILFLISPGAQQTMIFGSPWLPVSNDCWGGLGARQTGYQAFSTSADFVKAPPRPLRRIEKAMTEAGKMLLIEHATADQAIAKYRDIMVQD